MFFYYSHIYIPLGTLILMCPFMPFFFLTLGLYALHVIESIRYGDTR